jgi:hypothetical protein
MMLLWFWAILRECLEPNWDFCISCESSLVKETIGSRIAKIRQDLDIIPWVRMSSKLNMFDST